MKFSVFTVKSLLLTIALFGFASPRPIWAQEGGDAKPAAKADPDAEAKAKLEIVNEGELRLDGQITGLTGTGSWQMQAASWTSPRGVTTDFDEPKNKGVKLSDDAYLHPRGELEKVPFKDVKLGARIAVIGKNGPDGSLVAREVILLEGYGSRKMVGSVAINPMTSALVRKSRAARDAGLMPKALDLADQAIKTAQGLGDQSGEALATNDKANILTDLGKIDEAIIMYKREETLGRAVNSALSMCLGMQGQGTLYLASDRLKEAIDILKEADPISANAEPEIRLGVLGTLAVAYLYNEDFNEGIAVMTRLAPLQQIQGQDYEAGKTLLTIALLTADQKPTDARTAIEEAKPRIERARDDKSKAALLGATGLVQWRLGDKEDAQASFAQASQLSAGVADDAGVKKWDGMTARLENVQDEWQDYWAILRGRPKSDAATDEGKEAAPPANTGDTA